MEDLFLPAINACIVVLGDIGRSPRMQYHACSLLEHNCTVEIIGYQETEPLEELCSQHSKCKIHCLTPVPYVNFTPTLKLIFKTIWQSLSLLRALFSINRPTFLLVQNPPGIPTLMICYLYCLIMRSKLIIDWHNYTYTILALSMKDGERNLLCRFARWLECYFGGKADAHFCVTKAMQMDLNNNWSISNVTVLYDRPTPRFQPIDLYKKHDIFMKLSKSYSQFRAETRDDLEKIGVKESTAFTQKLHNDIVQYKADRNAILISSTSWTPDEDFGILLKALEAYENNALQHSQDFPNLLCIITGKGPQKDEFVGKIERMKWVKVSFVMPWLDFEDYCTLLAAADLGVCLHWSSSGYDLPMKIVDMFGCGLPVCAYNFKCLDELVKPHQNGFVFENHQQLSEHLNFWFEKFPNNANINATKQVFIKHLQEFQGLRWRENWNTHALGIFNKYF
uniref:Beta-1,4-mannosyltransferase n=1 Tax=Glossina morsitans morsitans TaxID=37546 RepID=A0A1B0GCV1_GLOMM